MDGAIGLRIGAFCLESPVARGGMGAVWRATHVEHGLPVALKVLSCAPDERDDFAARFRDEVRAVAALDHPNIATILDHGEIDAATARASDGAFVRGSPWFAMEYASGGTLVKWPRGGFADLKRAWLQILDGLAHAHARGVVHRDLKPGNVLLAGPPEALPPIKLVDFGVAFARHDPSIPGAQPESGGRTGPIDEQIVGTPAFMAPEQLRGEWRDYGPWTDLYAVGCLCWGHLCGKTPFAGRSAADTMVAHLTQPVPRLVSSLAVPPELEGWLQKLLEKDPARRFQRAADAASALAGIGAAVDRMPEAVLPDYGETQVWAATTATPPSRPRSGGSRPRPAPMPVTWRHREPPPPPLPVFGASLRLFGLRRIPLVGREAERDRLWELLGEVTRSGKARAVVVRGAAGTGKSALVQWLCERAHETGAASWVKASFVAGLTQGEPLRRMAVTFLSAKGLGRAEVRERVVRFLESHGAGDGYEADVMTELTCPATPADLAAGQRPVRLTRFREFYAGTRNAVARLASERPVVLWLDDVQWGIHGIGLAAQILRTRHELPFPGLVVLTVRDEALVPGSLEEDRLQKLLATPEVAEIRLGPLPREAQGDLVSRMLWLSPGLAAQVVERTAGNPLFAVQLVSSLVRRGDLRLGDRGLELAKGAATELPADVADVWRRQLARVLSEFPERVEAYLEIAAVLRTPVDRKEWRRACEDPEDLFGDRFPGDEGLRARLVGRLIEERLAVRTPQGWAFVHGMLEEALVASAARAGRLRQHHQAAATMLAKRADDPAVAERLGVHLLAAGRPADAVEPLLRGVEVRWVSTGAVSALALLQQAREAAKALPPADPRHARLLVLAAGLHLELGDPDAARSSAELALERSGTWRAHEVLAALALREGDVARAERAWAALRSSPDPRARAHGEKGLGQLHRRRQQLPEAVACFEVAADRFRGLGDPVEAASCDVLRGRVLLLTGDRPAARAALDEARRVFGEHGAAAGVAEALDALARLLRAERDPAAEDRLREALSVYEALGSAEKAHVARLRLAAWLAHDRRMAEVVGLVERASRASGLEDLDARETVHCAARWAAAGVRGDLSAWDEAFAATASGVARLASPRTAFAAEMVAWLGWIAAAALPRAERGRAETALAGVRTVFGALMRPDLVDELKDAWRAEA